MADTNRLIFIVLIGLAAGVLASLVIPTGLNLLGAIIVGILGALIGSYLFPALGANVSSNPTVAAILTATAGAIVLLILLRVLSR